MWDPEKYLDYAELRARPFHELLARVRAEGPRRVTDLGCGPGHLTAVLAERWPDAHVEATDSSPEMVAAARAAGVRAEVGDVREWRPAPDTGVVICNAVLQWVPEHRELLARWAAELPSGAWLAVQMPGNFAAPSHALIRELAAEGEWPSLLPANLLRDENTVATPQDYADLLADAGCVADAWETTYVQPLTGPDAVLEWLTGTALRPVMATLDEQAWQRFTGQLAPRLAAAYPRRPDGVTWLPFRRVFAVAQA